MYAASVNAFAEAIRDGKPFAPSFREQLKMHYVWDATELSMRERRWVKVEYGELAPARSGAQA